MIFEETITGIGGSGGRDGWAMMVPGGGNWILPVAILFSINAASAMRCVIFFRGSPVGSLVHSVKALLGGAEDSAGIAGKAVVITGTLPVWRSASTVAAAMEAAIIGVPTVVFTLTFPGSAVRAGDRSGTGIGAITGSATGVGADAAVVSARASS